MSFIKTTIISFILLFIMTSFSNCSSTKETSKATMHKIQEEAPFPIGKSYYQHWIAGVKGGGSGINLFLPSEDTTTKLDSAFFRGMKAKIEIKQTGYVAHFKTKANAKEDIIMSKEQHAEYGNKIPNNTELFPFELKDNECVISYINNEIVQYFKIENLIEKARQEYPSAPPQH